MTRRAPPLEINSCHTTTEPSVHRHRRWAGLILTLAAALLGGCKVLPDVELARTLPVSRSRVPVDIESPQGMVSRAAKLRISRQLAATGDTSLLDYHLAAMRDLDAPPLLTGNQVELLIDGPRTYQAMFGAIEKLASTSWSRVHLRRAVQKDRKLSCCWPPRTSARRIYVIYDAIGSLTNEAEFPRTSKVPA